MKSCRIALIQNHYHDSPESVVESTLELVKSAVNSQARVICLQELFNLPYFCRVQDPDLFSLAEPDDGPTIQRLQQVASEHSVYLIVPFFESVHDAVYYNSVVVVNPDGQVVEKYRKMHIPQDPGFEEKFYFSPGDQGWPVFDTPWGKMGVLICWDQWYPEAARMMALRGAKVIFYPTAIGRLESEPESLGIQQHQAWQIVQRGHGVANGCYIAAANRVGKEAETFFWGRSFVSDFYGSVITEADSEHPAVTIADLDFEAQNEFRRIWPFFRDRRIDVYQDLTRRVIDH